MNGLMLNSKQIELMELIIEKACLHFGLNWIFRWDMYVEDTMLDFSQETSDKDWGDVKFSSIYFWREPTENIGKKDVLRFDVKVFKEGGQSDWVSLTGKFIDDNQIDATIKTNDESVKSVAFSISR